MEPFPYLAGFSTFILTLAVAHLLKGLTDLFEVRDRVRWDPVYLAFVGAMLPMVGVDWWVHFRWRTFDGWTMHHFWFLTLRPILVYVVATLLIPRIDADREVDLPAHFQDVRRVVFGALAVYTLLDIADTMLKGWTYFVDLLPVSLLAPVLLAAFHLSAALTTSRRYLAVYVAVFWVLMFVIPLAIPSMGAL